LSEFPDEADLRLLRECQVKRMKVVMEATPGTEVEWRELAELTLSRVLVFNARRGSEAAQLLMEHYATASADVDPVLHSSLSTVEKELLNRLKVVNVVAVDRQQLDPHHPVAVGCRPCHLAVDS